MASGNLLEIFYGLTPTKIDFVIQMQKNGSTYQVRIMANDDTNVWKASGWSDLTAGWNAIEIQYMASHQTGEMNLVDWGTR